MTIDSKKLGTMLLTLMDEAFEGPAEPPMARGISERSGGGLASYG